MKEIDKDDVPDASGGFTEGCIPAPMIEPILPDINDPYSDPLGDRRPPNPWERYQIDGGIS
jgi:hypothetical protein